MLIGTNFAATASNGAIRMVGSTILLIRDATTSFVSTLCSSANDLAGSSRPEFDPRFAPRTTSIRGTATPPLWRIALVIEFLTNVPSLKKSRWRAGIEATMSAIPMANKGGFIDSHRAWTKTLTPAYIWVQSLCTKPGICSIDPTDWLEWELIVLQSLCSPSPLMVSLDPSPTLCESYCPPDMRFVSSPSSASAVSLNLPPWPLSKFASISSPSFLGSMRFGSRTLIPQLHLRSCPSCWKIRRYRIPRAPTSSSLSPGTLSQCNPFIVRESERTREMGNEFEFPNT